MAEPLARRGEMHELLFRHQSALGNEDLLQRDRTGLDVEAILLEDLERTGAIVYYRE